MADAGATAQPAAARWDFVPGFVFDVFPYRWEDPDVLPYLHVYQGQMIKAVRDDPAEFVRDDFRLFDPVSKRASG
jgi:hypothetical protein